MLFVFGPMDEEEDQEYKENKKEVVNPFKNHSLAVL